MSMFNNPDHRFKRMAIGFMIFLIFGILHTWVIFPPILKAILKMQVVLKPGTQMRDMYEALPFPMIFKIYIFNVLNPDEVMKGAKPKLQEMGPFVFEEWKTKVDIVEDKEADTLEFTAINTFIFNETLSNGLTGDEIVTVPHPLILGMALAVNVDRAPMLPLISAALNEIFHKPESAFWTGKAMDLLFNGIDVDCTSEDFNSKATCSVFDSGDVKAVVPKGEEEDMFLFSILGAANGTSAGRFKTYRGIKNIHDLGRVIEFNEEPELDVWDGDECNEFRGTESSIIPPFMAKEDGIWAFEASICRSMKAVYDKPSKYRGIPTLRYHLDLGDIPVRPPDGLSCSSVNYLSLKLKNFFCQVPFWMTSNGNSVAVELLEINNPAKLFYCKILKHTNVKCHVFSAEAGLILDLRHLKLINKISQNDESQQCFCVDDVCPVKGTMNLLPCVGTPLVASMPHFYNGDPSLFEKIESGLEPEKEKHAIYIDLEIISGTPLSAAKRLQFNIDLLPLQEIEVMKELPEMVFNLLWVEEGVNLNKTFVNMLKYQLFLGLKYQAAVKWLSLAIGPIGFVSALFLDYRKRRTESLGIQTVDPPVVQKITEKPEVTSKPPKKIEMDVESVASAKTQELNEKERY